MNKQVTKQMVGMDHSHSPLVFLMLGVKSWFLFYLLIYKSYDETFLFFLPRADSFLRIKKWPNIPLPMKVNSCEFNASNNFIVSINNVSSPPSTQQLWRIKPLSTYFFPYNSCRRLSIFILKSLKPEVRKLQPLT